MMYNNSNPQGFDGLRWKTDNWGTSCTLWCRETKKKNGFFKYTIMLKNGKTLTFLVSPGSKIITDKFGNQCFPIKILAGQSTKQSVGTLGI